MLYLHACRSIWEDLGPFVLFFVKFKGVAYLQTAALICATHKSASLAEDELLPHTHSHVYAYTSSPCDQGTVSREKAV